MSLINDALNKAKQAPPRNLPNALPPMQPVAGNETSAAAVWLVPAIVIFLIVAAIFFIGWAAAHNSVHDAQVAQQPISATQQVESTSITAILQNTNANNYATDATDAPPSVEIYVPKLQGIFYSPTAPTAILDGKTVGPGDQFKQYRVKAITKYTVILIGPDNKEITVGIGG
jgi:hypothetical protein